MRLTTRLQMLLAFVRLVRDPSRLNEVFVLADRLTEEDTQMMDVMLARAHESGVGARAFVQRPRLELPPLDSLGASPPGSLGRAFADFLNLRGLDPYGLPRRPAVDEPTYLTAHLYETHDLWHVVTGFDTDVAGELGLQAFYLPQLHGKLPLLLLAAGLLNTLLFAFDDWRARLDAIVRGYRMGQRARPFFGVRWGEWWERTLTDVRQELRVEPETEEVSVAPSEPGLPPQRATAS